MCAYGMISLNWTKYDISFFIQYLVARLKCLYINTNMCVYVAWSTTTICHFYSRLEKEEEEEKGNGKKIFFSSRHCIRISLFRILSKRCLKRKMKLCENVFNIDDKELISFLVFQTKTDFFLFLFEVIFHNWFRFFSSSFSILRKSVPNSVRTGRRNMNLFRCTDML